MKGRTPLTELEKGIAAKLARASFPPATASKRFARDLAAGYVRELSDRGRMFLAWVVYRFRLQYTLNPAEQVWVSQWLSKKDAAAALPASLARYLESEN